MKHQVIIGSTAMNYHFSDFNREPNDLDIVVSEYKNNTPGVEYHLNPYLLEINFEEYITPENMLALKVSHMFWDNNWSKHMWDIQFLLNKGIKFNFEVYYKFREYWDEVLPKIRRSDLEMTKEDFFTNSVNEDSNQHDQLHYLLNPTPMFTRILKDDCDVELDESKWDALSFEEKCDVVYEEVCCMSYERYCKIPWQSAYIRQLKDCIVKHFPEYISLFSIFNYIELQNVKNEKLLSMFMKLKYEDRRSSL